MLLNREPRSSLRAWLTGQSFYLFVTSVIVICLSIFSGKSTTTRPAGANTRSPDMLPPTHGGMCQVVRIIDGDSLVVSCNQQRHELRLMHIDAPEFKQPIWGKFASDALTKLAQQSVYVDFHGRDAFSRDLAMIYPSNHRETSINQKLVEQGAARVYSQYQPPAAFKSAMTSAKQAKIGIWQTAGLHQDPKRYRRLAN